MIVGVYQLVINIKQCHLRQEESLVSLRNMEPQKSGTLMINGYILDVEKVKLIASSFMGMPVENKPTWLARDYYAQLMTSLAFSDSDVLEKHADAQF